MSLTLYLLVESDFEIISNKSMNSAINKVFQKGVTKISRILSVCIFVSGAYEQGGGGAKGYLSPPPFPDILIN